MMDVNLNDSREPKPDLETTLSALKSHAGSLPNATIFYGLSGLSREEAEQIRVVWETLPASFRRQIMRGMIEVSENNFELEYRAIAMVGLDDSDPAVRVAAIEVLWEDETLEIMNRFIEMGQKSDQPAEVKAALATALGRFILLDELGDIPSGYAQPAFSIVLSYFQDETEPIAVRRRALEAIANSSSDVVSGTISQAYHSDIHEMQVSAVFAMGRTCDDRWQDILLIELDNEDDEIRYEAARAVGELELQEAIPGLARLLVEGDREIKEAAIWSLGEIGGMRATDILNNVAEVAEDEDDKELLDAVEEALGNAALVGDDLLLWDIDEDILAPQLDPEEDFDD